jgi:hypothetical protein
MVIIMLKGKALRELRKQSTEFMERWKAAGKKVASYFCPHCQTQQETIRPTRKEVGSKGHWDGLKTCVKCGKGAMVQVFPNGKTISRLGP